MENTWLNLSNSGKMTGLNFMDRLHLTKITILVLAVPSVFTRSTAVKMAPFVKEGQIIVCVAKGIEENTLMTISDRILDGKRRSFS